MPARKSLLMHRERRGKEGRTRVLISCRGFPNVPLMGTRGCINYNPVLAIRQLGYPMRGAPLEEELAPVISRGFSETNMETLERSAKHGKWYKRRTKSSEAATMGPLVATVSG